MPINAIVTLPVQAAFDAILSRAMDQPLVRLVDAAAHAAEVPSAILTVRRGPIDEILAARGVPLASFSRSWPVIPGTNSLLAEPVIIEDLQAHPALARHVMVINAPFWRWVAMIPVPLPGSEQRVTLCCGDPRIGVPRAPNLVERLKSIAAVIADEIELIGEIATSAARELTNAVAQTSVLQTSSHAIDESESPAVVTNFLLSTLHSQRRLLRRGDVSYHAIAQWRTPVKRWQIAALKALKQNVPEALIEHVANDMAEAANALYGKQTFRAVCAVPCGHSGSGCFADKLALRVSIKLNVPYICAFENLQVTGSSHPKRNVRRPAMRVQHAPEVAVLLIDDVATSGTHIEEAAQRLRKTAPAVLPLVWIAS